MFQTNQKAQSGLEYLMTYGWALVLITAVLGVLVFIVSSPASEVTFSSSDPAKIMLKSGVLQGSTVTVVLQNITGGKITVGSISVSSGNYSGCQINEEETNIEIGAGGLMELKCTLAGDNPAGAITINYNDFANLPRTTVISIGRQAGSATGEAAMEGSGTSEDPYIILNADHLQAMKDNLSAWYELGAEVGASETATWNEDPENPGTYFGFEPIGNTGDEFTGNLDGKDHTINNLYIKRDGGGIGLFGAVGSGAEISNLELTNVTITMPSSSDYVGAMAGYNDGTISNTYATGSLEGSSGVGGLVGRNFGIIQDSYSAATATGATRVGGLVGLNGYPTGASGTIKRSYATGNVFGTSDSLGGLVGATYYGTISDSYATGNVNGGSSAGGLVGNSHDSTITNSYSIGGVSGSGGLGGFVASIFAGSCSNCFWDTETSGQADSVCGTGKTTAEMKTASTFTSAGWSNAIWNLADGSYPTLK